MLKTFFLLCSGNLSIGGRGWYHMCSCHCQSTVSLVVLKMFKKFHLTTKQFLVFYNCKRGAGKKTGISEIRYIDMDISKIDTFDDVISDIGNRYVHIDMSIFS